MIHLLVAGRVSRVKQYLDPHLEPDGELRQAPGFSHALGVMSRFADTLPGAGLIHWGGSITGETTGNE